MWTESCFIGESHLNIGEEIFDIQHERLSNDDKAGGVDNATLKALEVLEESNGGLVPALSVILLNFFLSRTSYLSMK